MGNILIISYDLSEPGRNYTNLIQEIKTLGLWAHTLDSVWYVKSSLSASEACDRLIRAIDQDDSLLVVDATNNNAAWKNLKPEVAAFIKENWLKRYAA